MSVQTLMGRADPLRADTPAADAFAQILTGLLQAVRDDVEGTIERTDAESVHDLRVAIRRTRAVMRFANGVIPEETRSHYASELKWLGRQASPTRDLDVYLEDLGRLDDRAGVPAGLGPLRDRVTCHRARTHAALRATLRSGRATDLLRGWERDLATTLPVAPEADTPIGDVAAQRLAKAWKRVKKRRKAVAVDAPADAVHDLRKRCKELRYLLELFGPVYADVDWRTTVKELKRLQKTLGSFQDARAHRAILCTDAAEVAGTGIPATTLFAIGRLDRYFEEQQARARAKLPKRWRRFKRNRNAALFTGSTLS